MDSTAQEALSADIRLLGGMLGDVMRRVAGEAAFDLEEEIRAASKALRGGHTVEEARRLRERLDSCDLPQLRTLIRAFTVFFDLVNLAEQQARVRVLRERLDRAGPLPVAESIESALRQLRLRGVKADQLAAYLDHAAVRPVFTAHPSEARRRTVLEKIRRVTELLDRLERTRLVPTERAAVLDGIAEEIEALWMSDLVRVQRPSVLDEVRQGLQVVEGALFDVVPGIYRRLEEGLRAVYPEFAGRVGSVLRFGSWIGGDRDGNPFVDHEATAKAVGLYQHTVLTYYQSRMTDLVGRLSHTSAFAPPPAEFVERLEKTRGEFPEAARLPVHEPYRLACGLIAARLERTRKYLTTIDLRWSEEPTEPPAGIYLGREHLADDLRALDSALRAAGAESAANGVLADVIRLVDVFGLHLLTLDVRQHSARHASAVAEVLAWGGVCDDYREKTPEGRFELLSQLLASRRPLIPTHLPFSDDTVEVIQTFRTISSLLERQCAEAIRTYIISMATEPAHILEVLLLAREARLFDPETGYSRLDIVPLFETLDALRSAVPILTTLSSLGVYRKQLALRADRQEVMIGYSDSNKESGFLQSVWALYRTQVDLARLSKESKIEVQFFHGRGGAIGRGGGPANRVILAQPAGTVNGRIRITEQGEVIADRYGHHAIADRHLEQVMHAVLLAGFPAEGDRPDARWEKVMDRLAESARRTYRALVYENPEFLPYFEQATPIAEISDLKLGSRPARRSAAKEIGDLRAIPWVFSWMQSRHTLPGWYGLGTAIAGFIEAEKDGLDLLRTMYERWPFWTTTLDNAQMILSKADMPIARMYADLVEDKGLAERVYGRIAEEYDRTVDVVCRVTRQGSLLERMPVLQRSIQQRNPYVDPLSFIQTVLLRRLRSAEGGDEELRKGVLESINGIASGLKNTG